MNTQTVWLQNRLSSMAMRKSRKILGFQILKNWDKSKEEGKSRTKVGIKQHIRGTLTFVDI